MTTTDTHEVLDKKFVASTRITFIRQVNNVTKNYNAFDIDVPKAVFFNPESENYLLRSLKLLQIGGAGVNMASPKIFFVTYPRAKVVMFLLRPC